MCSIVIIYYAIHLCLWLIFLLQLLTLNVWCLFQHHFSITNQAANFSSDANCPGLPSVSTSNGWSPMRWHPPQRPTKKSKVPTTPTLLSFYNLLEQLTDPREMLHLLLPTYKAHIPGTAKEKAHIMQGSAEAGGHGACLLPAPPIAHQTRRLQTPLSRDITVFLSMAQSTRLLPIRNSTPFLRLPHQGWGMQLASMA